MTPNILLILINDLEWRDLSCYNSTFYETPHVDRLCEHGMRFTGAAAYASVCSPTRASMLTGKYPATLSAYKLIEFFEDRRVELYTLASDIGETHNLAAEQPDSVVHLHALLADWCKQTEASVPLPNAS
jgi:arylsulfatase A-like enzyme